MSDYKKLRVIISGGGTGGHIFPAISIANALRELNPETEFLFIGAEGRMEMEKVPASGYKIIGLPVVGLKRKLSLDIFVFIYKTLKSVKLAKSIIKEFKPDIAIGVGGYASGPALKAASTLKIPCLIQEQNSYPGITNKMLAKKAQTICVAYDNMETFFPAHKIVKTGNPIRQDIINLSCKNEEAYTYFKLDSKKQTVLVVGGSLGARTINEAINKHLQDFIDNDIQLIWQTGKNYISTAQESVNKQNSNLIYVSDFIYKMDLAFSAADIIISRAGASTISELCLVAKPTILVPSPNVAEDHQTKNAKALSNIQAAIFVSDADAANSLVSTALNLINDNETKNTLTNNIKRLALPDAANRIAKEVYKLVVRG